MPAPPTRTAPGQPAPVSYTHLVRQRVLQGRPAFRKFNFYTDPADAKAVWIFYRLQKQSAKAAGKTAAATEKLTARVAGFVKRHPVGCLLALACVLVIVLLLSLIHILLVCVAIYAVLIQGIATGGDPIGAIWGTVVYTVLLCYMLFKTGGIAQRIFGAH